MVVLDNFYSQLSSHFWSENSQVSQWSSSLDWIDGVCEHVSGRVILKILNYSCIITADKPNVSTETLASCT